MIFFKSTRLLILLFSFATLAFMVPGETNSKYKLIVFEGSDWCLNCMIFEEEVLSDSTFILFTNEYNIEIERIDFPQRKKLDQDQRDYNASIAERYSFQGVYPTIILTNPQANDVIKINYARQNKKEFVNLIKSKMTVMK